jgi:hypothetical protein
LAAIVKLRRKEKGLAIGGLLGVLFAVLIIGLLLVAVLTPKKAQPISPKLSKIERPNVPEPSKQEQLFNIQLATAAANRDFPGFLTGAWSRKVDYGFKATDEQNDVSLAEPVLVYSIDEKIIGNLNGVAGLVAAVKPIGELIYPVQVKQEYRSLFGVRLRSNNEWRGTYLGNPYLAASLQGIRKAWPSKDGDGFKLVSCIQPRSFFFIALNSDKPNLTPVTRVSLENGKYLAPPPDWNSITPAETVLESLKRFWKSDTNGIEQLNDANQLN